MARLVPPLVIIGGGGHASVLAETARAMGLTIAGYTAPQRSEREFAPYLGEDKTLDERGGTHEVRLVVGVGSTRPTRIREDIFRGLATRNYAFATLIHPSAVVASTARISDGTQVLAGCIVQSNVVIEENVILNTGSTIDHDSQIGAHTHIAPRAVLCGGVIVGRRAHIGAGAIVLQNSAVPDDGFVRAGEVLSHA